MWSRLLLPPRKTWYSLYKRLGGPQVWSGWVWKISSPLTGIRSLDRPAHNESQHQLRYPGPHYYSIYYNCNYNNNYYYCFVCYLYHIFSLAPLRLYIPDDRGMTLCCLGTKQLHCTQCHYSMWQEQFKTINNLLIIKGKVFITK